MTTINVTSIPSGSVVVSRELLKDLRGCVLSRIGQLENKVHDRLRAAEWNRRQYGYGHYSVKNARDDAQEYQHELNQVNGLLTALDETIG